MGQAETKIFENAPVWHESDILATTDFEEEVEFETLYIDLISFLIIPKKVRKGKAQSLNR